MRVYCEWGEAGAAALADRAAVAVIFDVLSFSTAVDAALSAGAVVLPFAWREGAEAAARDADAILAGRRRDAAHYSLSPPTLVDLPDGARLLLPSPNGSTISAAAAAAGRTTLAGSLRNRTAVAAKARALAASGDIALIPAGERWPDGGLRPAIEDLIGAGAVADALGDGLTPEAEIAAAAFRHARGDLHATLAASTSGLELAAMGFPQDVAFAAKLDVSQTAPVLVDGRYRNAA